MNQYRRIVILTGAGVSAESGLGTFRDKNGLWTKYDLREVATPEGFAANPHKVHEFYNARRQNLKNAKPNAAHLALSRLEKKHRSEVLLVTQNVDNLHEQAGSGNLIHMHGELAKIRCQQCDHVSEWTNDLSVGTPCLACAETGTMRPHIVWFGETPFDMNAIYEALSLCNLFVSIGTSGSVYPASGFVDEALRADAHTVELNLEPSEGQSLFAERHYGPATKIVPDYVARLLEI